MAGAAWATALNRPPPVARRWRSPPLTADHTPLRPDEAARVLASRGRIGAYSHNGVPVGPLRVWLPTVDAPGLCMTRAIGDTAAAGAGVVARAETGHAPITPATRYIVLVSDGVTEFATDGDIMAAVHAVACAGGGPADAAAALVARARGASGSQRRRGPVTTAPPSWRLWSRRLDVAWGCGC